MAPGHGRKQLPYLFSSVQTVVLICLLWPYHQLSFHWVFKPLAMRTTTSVYLSFAPCKNVPPKEMLNMFFFPFFFSSKRTNFFVGFQVIAELKQSFWSPLQLFSFPELDGNATHHLLQRWQNVQIHSRYCQAQLKALLMTCALNEVRPDCSS